jgi:hypothetical protein
MSSSSTCLVMALYIPFNQTVLTEHKIYHPNQPCCQVAEISADYQKRGRIKKQGEGGQTPPQCWPSVTDRTGVEF